MSKNCETCGFGREAVGVVVDNHLTDAETLRYNDGLPYCLDDEGYSMIGALLCGQCSEVAETTGYTVAEYAHVPALDILAERV